MDDGFVVIHGDARDILGYSMRGGVVIVKGSVGYRLAIHMKEYGSKKPMVIVGGTARDFCGEYMAGGIVVIPGLDSPPSEVVGYWVATGIHGGVMYVRGRVRREQLGFGAKLVDKLGSSDREVIRRAIDLYAKHVDPSVGHDLVDEFVKIIPVSHKPYGRLYVLE